MRRIMATSKKKPDLIYLCSVADIHKGNSKTFSIADEKVIQKDIAVFNINGNFCAISNICVHKGGPLSQGILEESIVTCPWHGWKYDVRTGKSPHKGGDSVESFKVHTIGDKLYIDPIPMTLGTRSYKPHKACSIAR
jgi:nitrite reductase (NADH) small subunit